ncbi:MAG: MFS transporter [Bacteroidales bacterium]|jgi:FHS family L-fucose permease-like MFS transporter|nr:MFS transporter [Bacteroidales bacterium]MBR5174992.1 MFS transporter [Bacteroidales bacterium]
MEKKKTNMVAIVTMCFIFAMISFVTNMAAPFGNIWGNQYPWSKMAGNLMNFVAYLFMGIPAGKMLLKIGYKNTTLVALATGFIGVVIQWLSSKVGGGSAIYVYLLGAFVCGFCVCMLNTVVNPMLNILGGGGNKGNQYIQIGGTLNSLTGTLTPLLVGALIGTVTASTSMSDVAPLLFIAMGVFALAFIIISLLKIPEPAKERNATVYEHSAWNFRHFVLGAIAIFFYVGIEIGIPSQVNFYLADATGKGAFPAGFAGAAAIGGAIAAIYWLLMMVGRLCSTFISGKVSTRTQMISVTSLAIVLVLIAIFIPKSVTINMPGYSAAEGFSMFQVPLSCLFLVLCGLCTSLMWGAIFNLAVEGLGKYTEAASGIFMMLVVGGGIMPFIQDFIAKGAGYMNSYWLVIAMLCYLLYYALVGCKNVNKDIPVD